MKLKGEINNLTEVAAGLTFPKFDAERVRFQTHLQALIVTNFGSIEDGLFYDDTSQTYSFAREDLVGWIDVTAFRATCNFTIDPSRDLLEQFENVEATIAQHKRRRASLLRWILDNGGRQ